MGILVLSMHESRRSIFGGQYMLQTVDAVVFDLMLQTTVMEIRTKLFHFLLYAFQSLCKFSLSVDLISSPFAAVAAVVWCPYQLHTSIDHDEKCKRKSPYWRMPILPFLHRFLSSYLSHSLIFSFICTYSLCSTYTSAFSIVNI